MTDPKTTANPETFRERVAWALCAHDLAGGEGRMSDDELDQLTGLYQFAVNALGWQQAQRRFSHVVQFIRSEKWMREKEGKELMRAHFIAADWPNYIGAADAAMGVLCERPEVAS
ncbi:MAG TPA: hypothetical protein VGV37_06510 [Aliidongia sp.]|uniref:hypothetical protein n=1 Tax=Aliidongia sp. TaxID=1914230 RepID=UPI002DDD3DF6|nr:hypothetical protein [Aliidongia sp.]HEV2674178.1 hypothetical protein [Aliidongia sp.]